MSFQQAVAHYHSGQWQEAERLLEQLLRTDPKHFDALHILSIIAYQTGRLDRAAALVQRALPLADEKRGDIYNTIGLIEHDRGDPAAAEAAFRTAVAREPRTITFHVNFASELHLRDKLDESVEAYRVATTTFEPTSAAALVGLGNVLRDRGELESAIDCYRQARDLDPAFISGHKNLIYYLHFSPSADMHAIRREQEIWSRRFADPLKARIRPHTIDRNPDRRLKIGYVSPNFYEQAECYFVLPLIAAHDRSQVGVNCYASGGPHDGVAAFHQKHCDVWHDVRSFSHDQLAETIRGDRIDILVDLNMHMANDSLAVFAQKPAPIQVTWLAYPGSTGLNTIDYRLTDRFIDPPESDQTWSAEEAIRLPDGWVAYDPIMDSPRVNAPPAATNGYITFGSLNNICKINSRVLDRWSRVLNAVAGSHLLLLCPEGQARRRVQSHFESRGVAPDRIEFARFTSRFEYLKLYHRIDIALDPFPYSGITTTCDALWMGVPVLTCPGEMPPSRAGLSCVANAGYPEWGSAKSEDDYIRLVADWSNDLSRLATIRATLSDRARVAPLMDARRFAKHLEEAYRQMWRRWCGERPRQTDRIAASMSPTLPLPPTRTTNSMTPTTSPTTPPTTPVSFEQAIALAMKHYAAGRIAEAESICRQVLAFDANNVDALHLLGLIALQAQNAPAAIELIGRAISLDRNRPDMHSNLGLAYTAAGRNDEAIAAYQAALALEPTFAQAHNNLGKGFFLARRADEAMASFRRAIELQPLLVEAHINLGNVLKQRGEVEESIAAYRAAVAASPEFADAHLGLGNALHAAGRLDEAVDAFRRALAIDPRLTKALNNLGNIFAEQKRYGEAAALYRRALVIDPTLAPAYVNLGAALGSEEKYDEAIGALRTAIRLAPDQSDAHYNLAAFLRSTGRLEAALEEFRIVDRLGSSKHNDVKLRIGLLLHELGRIDEVVEQMRSRLRHGAGSLSKDEEAWCDNILGNALKDRCELPAAMDCYRKALALDPNYTAPHNNLIYTMHFDPASSMQDIRAEQDRWSQKFAQPAKKFLRRHDNDRNPDRRLKIGYVSPNFRHQAEANFVLPILENHDHANFEIHCYASVAHPDNLTAGMQGLADAWHDVHRLKDNELAEKIRADQIDILVDLTMHMAEDRLLTFAVKPAPIQIAYLAYPGSTGLATMDYRITDNYMDPPGVDDSWASEQAIRLPDSWCVYHPVSQYPDVNELPALQNGHITFGSLNNFCKINKQVLSRWADLLRAIDRSRLILLCPAGESLGRTRGFFAERGISSERVESFFRLPRPEYLRLYHRIDIGLDPFPYNGITTTCDALWMGVPVLTAPGTTPPSRAGRSVLMTAGCPEMVATSQAESLQETIKLAADVARLAELRRTLRPRVLASRLMDARRFTTNLEAAYRQIWREWCSSSPGNE